eukprot:3899946-Rhodomonas_salina.1
MALAHEPTPLVLGAWYHNICASAPWYHNIFPVVSGTTETQSVSKYKRLFLSAKNKTQHASQPENATQRERCLKGRCRCRSRAACRPHTVRCKTTRLGSSLPRTRSAYPRTNLPRTAPRPSTPGTRCPCGSLQRIARVSAAESNVLRCRS